MKHICIITTSLYEEKSIQPLIAKIRKDNGLYLTLLSTCRHHSPEIDIQYRHIEEHGDTLDESLEISLNPSCQPRIPVRMDQMEYARMIGEIDPEIVVVAGNSFESFSAAIAANLTCDLPVAHIGGGESDFDPDGPSFGYGITKLAHLHFTTTEAYRQRVIGFGEHPERVFHTGALAIERLNAQDPHSWQDFCEKTDLLIDDRFLLVSLSPDRTINSRNRALVDNLLAALSANHLADYKLLVHLPDERGLGKILRRQMDEFSQAHPDRIRYVDSLSSRTGISAMIYCRAMIGNSARAIVEGASLKVPAVNIGDLQKDLDKAPNILDCSPEKAEILRAVDTVMSLEFLNGVNEMTSPFEKQEPALQIKNMLKDFTRADMKPKAYFEG